MSTIEEIASRAGCSMATVSRALNRSGPVSEAMLRRVRKAALELGYHQKIEGSIAAKRHRPVVGVLIPSISNPVFAASLSGIQSRMRVAGHGVLIAQSDYDPAREPDAIAALLAENPTGLIMTLCNPLVSQSTLSVDLPPTVLLHNQPTPRFKAAVTTDNRRAGQELANHLIHHGHRRILFVSGRFASSDRARLRYEGYCDAMQGAGLEIADALQVSLTTGYGDLDLSEILSLDRPTAIIASNDLLALGVISAVRGEGLQVPDDVSVAGFDGIAIGQLVYPPLTTIEMADASMGATAASLLLDMAANSAVPRHLTLGYKLNPGGTVRQAPQTP
ncbi:LacI family DNA-binding transcriptional regulator (plasmid) [Rhizobium sp. WL3]|uniref:substrate-binding domain-containing protein n=1 Tax=Rhizobium sp. WL3 TaxID=2603277 RepID=UPI0011C1E39B|nr:substrate-binding domain-containing protein [Rhizobium sp. WL3]QEE43766.1 LacI family DNA-binding transcriptional regulator [Rhizobium sp. WL3]